MAKIISFANQKGGVGKSTLCIQTAFYLCERTDKSVLVIDMDAQGNTSSSLIGAEQTYSGTRTADLFDDALPRLEVMKCSMGADLIYTEKYDPKLLEKEAVPLSEAVNPAKHIQTIADQYDYILIDCPPSLGRKLVAALMMSTHVVCPVKVAGFAVDGLEGLLATIIGIQESVNPDLNITGFIVNDMDRSVNHRRSYEQLKSQVPTALFKNYISHRPPLDAAVSEGKPVWALGYGHVAAKEVIAVIQELLERVHST